MKKNYDVVIIGGGVQGLSLAYHLARSGLQSVAVLEKSYIGSGASGRNGEMIRSAFGSEAWIRLFDKSLEIWETLSQDLDFNVMFTKTGYLVLASTPEELAVFGANIRGQHAFGLHTRLMGPEEVAYLIPALNPKMAAGGIFQSDGSVARHDAVVWVFAGAARRLKVDIFSSTEATGIRVKSGKIAGLSAARDLGYGDQETEAMRDETVGLLANSYDLR
jgi:sarcosine oxidase subunit beta